MEIPVLFLIVALCVVYRLLFDMKSITWFIFILSVLSLYYFQPISTIRNLDFWIPSFTLFIIIITWEIISNKESKKATESIITYGSLILFFIILSILRFLPQSIYSKITSIPPQIHIFAFVLLVTVFILIARKLLNRKAISLVLIFFSILIFVFIKNTNLSLVLSKLWRTINGQSINLANNSEIIWIGYSYFAFRLIHVLLEYRKGHKFNIELHTFIGYLLFFPALLAGPIMYLGKYQKELEENKKLKFEDISYAFRRIGVGLFQKFIIADLLAIIALDNAISIQVSKTLWMWFFVFAYFLRIYFDFNGYSHIAIGIAKIIGINLPENFKKPLFAPTLTLFWNNWHITLTQWFRSYYFNPVTRFFRKNLKKINQKIILAFMQITTMILIGLWHGVNWNFVLWGTWIGIGLFAQNQISGYFSKSQKQGKYFWQLHFTYRILSNALTLVFVAIGWVWFALPTVESSIIVFSTLLGLK